MAAGWGRAFLAGRGPVARGLRQRVRQEYDRGLDAFTGPSRGRRCPILLELLIILVLVLTNGLLAGSEIAVVSMRKTRVDELVAEGRGGSHAVAGLRSDPERFLATVQIGITVIGAAAGAFGGSSMARDLAPVLQPFVGEHAASAAFAIVVGSISYLSLVLGELVPKSLALRAGERYALLVARPLLVLARLSQPLVWLLTQSSNVVLRAFGDRTTFVESRISPGEIQQLVDEATAAGTVHRGVGEIASRAMEFGEVSAAQIMIPRHKMVSVPLDVSRAELRRVILEEGKSRIVVHDGSPDNVVGYVMLRDAVAIIEEGSLLVLEDAVREPVVALSSMRCVDLLAEMRRRRVQLAVVVDELGVMLGMATLEDVLEELVGEIEGEHEQPSAPPFKELSDGSVEVRADSSVRDLNRELGLQLPQGERFTTVAGVALEAAGRIPRVGEVIVLGDGTQIEVVEASVRRVVRVKIRRPSRPPPP
ncbi:MAG: HlyC/CorC family transporter [Polyangiaceae bacterium]|nr:HlyC/CorC family transporter [Polyangiaceae bacterium]